MAKVKSWLMDMEDDATYMSKAEFVKLHGDRYADIWERVNYEKINDEPYGDPEDFAQGNLGV